MNLRLRTCATIAAPSSASPGSFLRPVRRGEGARVQADVGGEHTREFAIFVTIGFGAWSFIRLHGHRRLRRLTCIRAWIHGNRGAYGLPAAGRAAQLDDANVLLVMAVALFWKPTPCQTAALFAIGPARVFYRDVGLAVGPAGAVVRAPTTCCAVQAQHAPDVLHHADPVDAGQSGVLAEARRRSIP
ncbi:MAG: hypothetical protein U1F20_03315 [Lysobacterales bacterium]